MFINFTIIIENIIDYIKLLVNNDYSFDIFKNIFNKIYDEKCKHIVGDIQPDVLPVVENIYVISDIHGDYEKLIELLIKASVIKIIKNNNNFNNINNNTNINIIKKDNLKFIQDNNNIIKWIGKDSIIVQVGDQIDRCRSENNCIEDDNNTDKNDDWKILKFMTLLNEIAMHDNGKVYSLLGNHEIMNTTKDFRYVSKKGIDNFSNDYDKDYLNKFNNSDNYNDISKKREEAFNIGNEISNFLACTRKLCIIIGTHVFVHGNISSKIAYKYKVSDMNKIVSLFLFDSLKLSDLRENYKLKDLADIAIYELLQSYNSPVWNRDLHDLLLDVDKNTIPKWLIESDKLKCDNLDDYLKKFISKSINYSVIPLKENTVIKVGNIIVGHTPQLESGYIKSRCNNKVWVTDYGSSIAFKKVKYDKIYPEIQILHIINDTIYKIIS
jgi:hypothetical protein